MFFTKSTVLAIFSACLIPTLNTFAQEKETIGWLEKVAINGSSLQLKAKIDTGATTSSIHSKVLKKFKKNNENWVRFRIKTASGNKIVLERKIQRISKIKRKLAFSIKRPVVLLGICIGNTYKEEEVNLAKRDNFVYPLLIGRNYLKGNFLVDSEVTFTRKPACKL